VGVKSRAGVLLSSSKRKERAQVFVVSLAWTRPKPNDVRRVTASSGWEAVTLSIPGIQLRRFFTPLLLPRSEQRRCNVR
jgi:hypothetical protein